MSTFATFNQFDKRFSDFEKFGSDRTACPLFGLITCYNFMLNGDISQKQHESNLYAAVTNYTTKDVPKYMLFDELLEFSNGTLNPKDINGTTPELLVSGIVGYEHIFKFGYDQNYCILFLKNRNYITILCNNSTYAVRDCHENTQRNFSNFEDMRVFINNVYQFEQETIVGGVRIPEFENIEFLTIEFPFELVNIDSGLIDDTLIEATGYDVEEVNPINTNVVFTKDDEYALAVQMEYGDGNGDDYVEFI